MEKEAECGFPLSPSLLRSQRKVKVFITETSRDLVSWFRYGEEGVKNLLKGVDFCSRDPTTIQRF